MAQDYNFKPSLDVASIAQLMQKKALAEQDQKNFDRQQKLKEIEFAVQTGTSLAKGMVELSKQRQQKEFADALASTRMTPGQETPGAMQQPTMDRPDVTKMVGGNNGPMTVAQGVPQDDGTVTPALEQAPSTMGPPTDNPTSTAIRAGANAAPQQFADAYAGQQFPNPQQMGMYGSGVPVVNKQTGERAFAQFGKDGSVFVNGHKLEPDQVGTWDREYAPQAIETTGGVYMAPKLPGSTVSTAGQNYDQKKGKVSRDQLTVPEATHLDRVKASLEKDTVYEKMAARHTDLQQATANLDTANWVGDATIPSLLAKGLGKDAGALSDQDQKRYNVSPEVWRRIKTKINRWTEGTLTPEDRGDIREALRVADEKNKDLMNKRFEIYEGKARAGVKNVNKEFMHSYLTGGEDTINYGGGAQGGGGGIDGIAQLLNLPRKK